MWYKNRWPSEDELKELEEQELELSNSHNEESDPICDCGNLGYMCRCEQIAMSCGYWSGGQPYLGDCDE